MYFYGKIKSININEDKTLVRCELPNKNITQFILLKEPANIKYYPKIDDECIVYMPIESKTYSIDSCYAELVNNSGTMEIKVNNSIIDIKEQEINIKSDLKITINDGIALALNQNSVIIDSQGAPCTISNAGQTKLFI